jgi:MFS family permease
MVEPHAHTTEDIAAIEEAARHQDGPSSSLAPFRHTVYRNVWIASLASNFGTLIQAVGASWLMTSITPSADMVALVQASTNLPVVLFALLAGAISDNFDRRWVMITAQGTMFVFSVALAVFAYGGWITPWMLLGFTFLIGCGSALNGPAWQSSVGDMVPRADLPAAVALNSMAFNIARSVGPAIGGAIVATAGASMAFLINALSYIGLISVLARWHPPKVESLLPRETMVMAMGAGLRYVAMSPNIVIVLVRSFMFGLGAIAVMALMPLMARDLIHGGPLTYGLLLGFFGIGAVIGALLSSRARYRLSVEWLVRWSFLGFAVCSAVSGLEGMTPLVMAAQVIGGACWVLALSTFNVTVQLSAPRWVVGRALALYQVATFGGMTFGSWLWGTLAEHYGVTTALQFAALASLVGGAIGFLYALPQLSMLNLDPWSRWKEPEIVVPIEPRSGPIVVTIEYIIDEKDVIAFLRAMADRKRVRRRDGARHWQLLRDLADARLWIERYHSPTWVEYVRQNHRVTHADAVVWERVRALHRGAKPPRVHRMIERQTAAVHHGNATSDSRVGTLVNPALADPLPPAVDKGRVP